MGKNDGARSRLFEDAACYDGRARPFPIERIDVPKDDSITEFGIDPLFLPRGDRAVRWPHQDWVTAKRLPNRIVRFLQLRPYPGIRHFRESRVRPAMVADLVSFAHRSLQDLGMLNRVLANDEESRVDVMLGQDVEQLRSQFFARAVIKSHRDIRPVDMHRAVADGWGRLARSQPARRLSLPQAPQVSAPRGIRRGPEKTNKLQANE